jgi:transglutaminase-like putative cysteine protease
VNVSHQPALTSRTTIRPLADDGGPTPADLASTDDANITQEVQALADQLQRDPVQIFSYVKNQVAFDPYYGSRKGSLVTLWERSGNDIDIASLLIALLRASGVPARYVQGTVSIDSTTLKNWVGNAADLASAQAILKSGGIPTDTSHDGTPLIQHVWVEVYNAKSSSWVGLDASFKQFRYAQPVDISRAAGFDAAGYVNQMRSGGADWARRSIAVFPRAARRAVSDEPAR